MAKKNKTRLARAAMTLLFALLTTVGAWAQETVTVYDGTIQSSCVPVWGLWADNSLQCEMVYPATVLEDMVGGTITSLQFYSKNNDNVSTTGTSSCWNGTFTVFMKEVGSPSISGFSGTTGSSIVCEAQIGVTDGVMTINLNPTYIYGGGNLLIGIYYASANAYKSITWLGKTVNGASIYGRSGQSYSATQANFLPKTTFTYEMVSTGCDMPSSIAVSNITHNSATVTWEGDGNTWNLRYKASGDADYTIVEGLTSQTYTFNGTLEGNTTYIVGVQTDCGGSTSTFRSTSFTTENPCAKPTNLETSNITPTSATLTWTAGYQETSWTVKYKKSTETEYTENTVSGSPTLTLTELAENTTYNVRVYNCPDDEASYVSGNFKTVDPGAAPTNLHFSDITVSSATLSWTPCYQETSWTVKYKKSSETEYSEPIPVSDTPTLTLTGLESLTTYNVQVYNGEKYVSGNFTTGTSIPLVERFGSSFPTGWAQYSGLLASVMNGTAQLSSATYGWSFGTNNGVFDNHARVNIYGSSCKYWLVTPSIMMENNVQLTFDLALTDYNGTLGAPQTNGTDDKFVVLITTDGGTTWTILRQWDNAGSEYVYNNIACSAMGQNVAIDLSSYAGQNIAIAFYGESTESNADNNLHIDNVSINYIPSCAKPTNLEVTVSVQDATLTWETDARWSEIVHSMNPGFDPNEEQYPSSTDNVYTTTFFDLDFGDHYFWVRSCCNSTDNSEWAGPISCHIGYCTPNPSSVDGNGISYVTFGTGDNVVNNGTPKATYADYTEQIGAVQAGVESTVSITYATGYTYGTIIWVDLDNSLSFEDNEIVYTGTSTSDDPTTLDATFIIPATQTPGDYRMRIGGADSAFDSYINNPTTTAPSACYTGTYACFQDYTLRVLEAPSCFTPTGLTISDVTGHRATISWTSDSEAWDIEVNGTVTTDITANPYTLTGLTPETEYTVKVRANCGDGDVSEWSNAVTFTTTIACPAPTNVVAGNITSTSAEISWTGNADATSYNLWYREADPSTLATVILTAGDVWGDGSGYQMLLDADATAYGNIFPTAGPLTSSDDASAETYAEFEFKIPMNADGALSTSNIVINNSVTIFVPAGTYDWCITNPTPGDRMWIASENGNVDGRYDDYEFEAGKIYEFTVSHDDDSGYDQVDVTITDGAKAIALGEANQWTTVSDATSPYSITGLTPATPYEVQVQAVYDEDNSDWTGIYFTTLDVASIHFAKEGYATYYNGLYDLLLPAGMQAKIVTAGDSDGTLTYQTIANGSGTPKNVPAGNAVLLQVAPTSADNPQTQDFELNLASGTTGSYTDNKLHGSDVRVNIEELPGYSAVNNYYYMLSYDTSGANIGWYWDKDNTDGTGFWSGAHKAWLVLPKSLFQGSGAPFLGLPGWEETTGIVPVGVNPEDGEWYTLQGMKVGKKPTTKGVYIHNGRKFVIK